MQPSDAQAKCALHPDRLATRTCPRCGNFACAECVPDGQVQCPACQQITGQGAFPFNRDTFTLDGLWSHSFQLWKREWVMLSVAYLIVTVAQWVGGMASSVITLGATTIVGDRLGPAGTAALSIISNVSNNLLGVVVAGTFQMGFIKVTLDVLHGRRADLAQLLTQFRKLPRYLVAYLLTGLVVGVAFVGVALVVMLVAGATAGVSLSNLPELKDFDFLRRSLGLVAIPLTLALIALAVIAIVAFTHFQLATFEIVHTDCGPVEALLRAFTLASGFRWTVVGYGIVAGAIIFIGVLACCVGVFPAAGLAELLMVSLFLSLRAERST